jgi:hypothetical protein
MRVRQPPWRPYVPQDIARILPSYRYSSLYGRVIWSCLRIWRPDFYLQHDKIYMMVLHANFRALFFTWRQWYLLFMEYSPNHPVIIKILQLSTSIRQGNRLSLPGYLATWVCITRHLIEILAVMFICTFFKPCYHRGKRGWPTYRTTN